MVGAAWEESLDGWLEPFLARLTHEKRRRWAPVYVQGLLGPGDRKSLQPTAARLGLGSHDQLHHFITSPAWDDAPLRQILIEKADALVGGPDAVLVIDDTALPKQGTHSVGVARQYCGCLGKRANGQVLVSLTLARGEVPVPIGLRLFLPAAWAADAERCARVGVPDEHRRPEAKTDIALAEVDRVVAAGARFGRVLADAGYGISAAFRKGLSARSLVWAVGIPKVQNVYSTAVTLSWPAARTGRPRKHPLPSERPSSAAVALAGAEWRRIAWRRGTKGPLAAEFAARRVRPAEGEQLRNGQHAPGDEVWLVGERRATGEHKYYLANLSADAPLEMLAATIKARPRPAAAGRACGNGSSALRSMDLRAGTPANEGRTRPRPLRGPLLDRSAPARADDDDRPLLPSASAARAGRPPGGKAAQPCQDRRRDPHCRRSGACCLSGSALPWGAALAAGPTLG